jgi:hypothetical protein
VLLARKRLSFGAAPNANSRSGGFSLISFDEPPVRSRPPLDVQPKRFIIKSAKVDIKSATLLVSSAEGQRYSSIRRQTLTPWRALRSLSPEKVIDELACIMQHRLADVG